MQQPSYAQLGEILVFPGVSATSSHQSTYAHYLSYIVECSQRAYGAEEDAEFHLASAIATITHDHMQLYYHRQIASVETMIQVIERRRGFVVRWNDVVYGSLQVLTRDNRDDTLILPVPLCERLAQDCAWCLHVLENETTRQRQRRQKNVEAQKKIASLSSAQYTVLELMAKGLSTRAIAETLQLSKRTVETHQQHIYHILDVHSQREAMLLAIEGGIIMP